MMQAFFRNESGNAAVGYGLIVCLIVLATFLTIGRIGGLFVETVHSVTPPPISAPKGGGFDTTDP